MLCKSSREGMVKNNIRRSIQEKVKMRWLGYDDVRTTEDERFGDGWDQHNLIDGLSCW